MTRPSALTRLMASRFVALVLMFASGAVLVGWVAGDAPWWLAIVAVLTQMQTLAAIGRVRRYKDWAAKWQAMAEPVGGLRGIPQSQREEGVRQTPASPAKAPRRGRLRIFVAALLALGIPLYVGGDTDAASPALAGLWLAVCSYLCFRLVRRVTRRRGQKRGEQANVPQKREAESPFVTWVMNRPSSSPSRAEATRALPDYCGRLLTR